MKRIPSRRRALLALGAAIGLTGPASPVFGFTDLGSGYMLAAAEGKPADKKAEEAKCGADCAKNLKTLSAADAKAACAKAHAEGKCGSAKERKEGKCGGKA